MALKDKDREISKKTEEVIKNLEGFWAKYDAASKQDDGVKAQLAILLLDLFAVEHILKITVDVLNFVGEKASEELLPKDKEDKPLICPPFYAKEAIDNATLGRLVSMYKQLRPVRGDIAIKLDLINKVRIQFVHKLFDPEIEKILDVIPPELKEESIKGVIHEIMSDLQGSLVSFASAKR